MFMLTVKLCQREITIVEIRERKSYRERSKINARVSVHWRARCHAKGQGATLLVPCGIWTHVARLTATRLKLALNHMQLFHWKIRFMTRHISYHSIPEPIFCVKLLIFGLPKSNIEVRQDTVECLTANLKSWDIIGCYIDWSWNIFSPYILLNAHRAGHWPPQKSEKMRPWNLGHIFKT